MPAIGYVTKQSTGGFKGQIKTLSIRADIDIVPNKGKTSESQPDFRVLTQGIEVGAGWTRTGRIPARTMSRSASQLPSSVRASSTPISAAPPDRMTTRSMLSSGTRATDRLQAPALRRGGSPASSCR